MSPLPIRKREPISMPNIACRSFPKFPLPSPLLYHPALQFCSQLSLRLFLRHLSFSDPLSLILSLDALIIRQDFHPLAPHHDQFWVWNGFIRRCKSKLFSSVYTCEFTRLSDGYEGLPRG